MPALLQDYYHVFHHFQYTCTSSAVPYSTSTVLIYLVNLPLKGVLTHPQSKGILRTLYFPEGVKKAVMSDNVIGWLSYMNMNW